MTGDVLKQFNSTLQRGDDGVRICRNSKVLYDVFFYLEVRQLLVHTHDTG